MKNNACLLSQKVAIETVRILASADMVTLTYAPIQFTAFQ